MEVRRAFDLTIDRREAEVLEKILSRCGSVAMGPLVCSTELSGRRRGNPVNGGEALVRYDDNGSGRITCREARRHGIALVIRDHPAYPFMRDADSDGVVCEQLSDPARFPGARPDRQRGRRDTRWCGVGRPQGRSTPLCGFTVGAEGY